MPEYRRWREVGATYFFTVVTYRRRRFLTTPSARRCLRQSFDFTRSQWPFNVYAFVLLPDHLHCIWSLPSGDDDFPLRWANIKRTFTKAYLADGGCELAVSKNRSNHNERGVWQPRYWEHLIRGESELVAYRDYIHLNPVKHTLTADPLLWPWSSVHRHLRLGWLSTDWTAWTPIKCDVAGE